jgi:hypothetical protein
MKWTLQPRRLLFSYLAWSSICIENVNVISVGSDAQLHGDVLRMQPFSSFVPPLPWAISAVSRRKIYELKSEGWHDGASSGTAQ